MHAFEDGDGVVAFMLKAATLRDARALFVDQAFGIVRRNRRADEFSSACDGSQQRQ